MSDAQTAQLQTDISANIGLQTEHAVALIALATLALLWTIRFTFPTP